jgi:Flp pilus assembly protein TadD
VRAAAAGLCTVLITAIPAGARAAPEEPGVCGNPFKNGVGPFDYNNGEERTTPGKIPVVEQFHFTPVVQSLARGNTSAYAMDDIDYTLRAVPNHHKALDAVARYDIEKGGIPPQWRSAQCWFDRATEFAPEDGQVWLIYANWCARKQHNDDALEAYKRAKALLPDSIEVDYNLGLLYYKMGDYEQARSHARIAYAGNYPLQGLRRRLAEKGYPLDR